MFVSLVPYHHNTHISSVSSTFYTIYVVLSQPFREFLVNLLSEFPGDLEIDGQMWSPGVCFSLFKKANIWHFCVPSNEILSQEGIPSPGCVGKGNLCNQGTTERHNPYYLDKVHNAFLHLPLLSAETWFLGRKHHNLLLNQPQCWKMLCLKGTPLFLCSSRCCSLGSQCSKIRCCMWRTCPFHGISQADSLATRHIERRDTKLQL